MESYHSSFLRYDHSSSYNTLFNGIQWTTNSYPSTLPLGYSLDSSNHQAFKTAYPAYDTLSTKYPLDSTENNDSTEYSDPFQHPKDHMHSLFGDPSALINQLMDELDKIEDNSSKPQPSNSRSTIYNPKPEHNNIFHENEKNSITHNHTNENPRLYNYNEDPEPPSNYSSTLIQDLTFNDNKATEHDLDITTDTNIESTLLQDQYQQFKTTSPIFSYTERPRQVTKNRGAQISALGLTSTTEETGNIKHNFLNLENDPESDQFDPDLEMLLRQMDRKEFQECWSKDWTLGLVRFCKYMQLSEKMQLGPAKKLKTDDNKCVILVLKKIFQNKPPSGWPNYGVRLQIQCGGYIQDILAWSSINRQTWKTIMPLIAKGITQLIKKVGGVHKLRNGHQPYFNACRNALREDVTLYALLKEYSRNVNSKKKRPNLGETESKESHND